MSTLPHSSRRLLACLLAGAFASAASAQSQSADPDAAVPETRYQPAHVARAPAAATTTPDRAWQENNRIVAGQPAHAGHAGHGKHTSPAKPAEDPHAHHHGHHAPAAKEQH